MLLFIALTTEFTVLLTVPHTREHVGSDGHQCSRQAPKQINYRAPYVDNFGFYIDTCRCNAGLETVPGIHRRHGDFENPNLIVLIAMSAHAQNFGLL
jgi:hypothetical protein